MSVSIYSAIQEIYASSVVKIECCFMRGYVGLQLLGNIGEITKNGLERAKTALEESGISLPQKKIVISLSPAEARKDGSQFDLALAVALAMLVKKKPTQSFVTNWLFVAELGLDGSLKPVKGVINFGIQATTYNLKGIVVAYENLAELSALKKICGEEKYPIELKGFKTLNEVLAWIFSGVDTHHSIPAIDIPSSLGNQPNFDDMVLSDSLKKIAMTVAIGFHNLLLAGTPGCGKSMFIQRLPSLFPQMPTNIHREALIHYSLINHSIPIDLLAGRPPLRMPHHQASPQAILGSANQPGELALAHGGLLFLDEFCEFRRDIVEGLREPLETGCIRVARAQQKAIWKAQAILAVAFNNCPCGWLGSKSKKCYCPTPKILSYLRKLSGPILDRIDIHVNMPEFNENYCSLFNSDATHQTERMLSQIREAREFGYARNKKFLVNTNSELKANQLLSATGLNEKSLSALLEQTISKGTTNRSVIRTLRVARTFADLDLSEKIGKEHLLQAWSLQSESAAKERGEFAYG